ncbi:NACHT domain-containing protein [Micromonospora citrea]|uniref:NACHT domain-containing protein n=1 Tax=Micromonospora citrea TaxID=47855 RepID=UPI003C3DF6EE
MSGAAEQYDDLLSGYLDGDRVTLYENLAALDFALRFVMLCAAATLHDRDPHQVNVGRAPGFGGYLAYLKTAHSLLGSTPGTQHPTLVELLRQTLTTVRAYRSGSPEFATLEQLRNHASHGGPIPTGQTRDELTKQVEEVLDAVNTAVRTFLADAAVDVLGEPTERAFRPVTLRWPNRHLALWPFICVDDFGRWCLYAQYTSHHPVYIRPGRSDVRVPGRDEDLVTALNDARTAKPEDTVFAAFVESLRNDLAGFRDPDYELHHYESGGVVSFFWMKRRESGVEERVDSFRIGPGEERQWLADGNVWLRYSSFLRHITNWRMVAKRIRQYLQGLEQQMLNEEQALLGWSRPTTTQIEPTVQMTDLGGSPRLGTAIPFRELIHDIDRRLEIRGPQTQVYFVAGEAGIGKTRALLRTTLERARLVEDSADDPAATEQTPLFLYVRSTGLDDLQKAIGSAVVDVPNVNDEAVRTLCRNGLMAVFIDGFDELRGGIGYGDALSSLRAWIADLGGRGVLLVSARSSYYLSQYRIDLQNNTQNLDLAVAHRVALVQRWTDEQLQDFLARHDVAPQVLDDIPPDDRDLLRLPFFAKVYVEAYRPRLRLDTVGGKAIADELPDLVLDQYISRESLKLSAGEDQDRLMSVDELRSLFQTLAELMATEHERLVTITELELAATVAIGDEDLEQRRGLRRRLTALCGMAVTSTGNERRFAFSHELFYDYFLADAMLCSLYDGNIRQVVGALGAAQWRTATIKRIVRRAPDAALDTLRAANGQAALLNEDRGTAFRANIGALWTALITQTGRLHNETVQDATFDTLDLTAVHCRFVRFKDCQFQKLSLPPPGTWDISLEDCEVDMLDIRTRNADLNGLKGAASSSVAQIVTAGGLSDTPREVALTLRTLGVDLPAQPESEDPSPLAEAVRYYLGRIVDRGDTIIVDRDHGVVNEHASWTKKYGYWPEFVKLLERSGVAVLTQIQAGGQRKYRLRFQTLPIALLHRDPELAPVSRFWELVEA